MNNGLDLKEHPERIQYQLILNCSEIVLFQKPYLFERKREEDPDTVLAGIQSQGLDTQRGLLRRGARLAFGQRASAEFFEGSTVEKEFEREKEGKMLGSV